MKNVIKKELIGCKVEVIESKNKSLIGTKGKIIDETRNMFVVETEKGSKKIIKNQATLMITFPEGKIIIEGKYLVGRPEKRIKLKLPKKRV